MGPATGGVVSPLAHTVRFYDRDPELVEELAHLLAEGLRAGEAAVAIATPDHLRDLDAALGLRGVDVDGAVALGTYVRLDAGATLSSFLVDGMPDATRFADVIGGVVGAAAQGGRPVRAFGEMVALLWATDRIPAAVTLEALWNDLLARHDLLSLRCAYPSSCLASGTDLAGLADVCDHHAVVLPPRSYTDDPAAVGGFELAEVSHVFLPAAPAPRAVRSFMAEGCRAWGLEHVLDEAAVVASELATNAVLHASTPFRVTLRRSDAALTIAVHDLSSRLPTERHAGVDALGGRGVPLVAAFSTTWGVERSLDGKVVWADLATRPDEPAHRYRGN